jgi:hypothetical protein
VGVVAQIVLEDDMFADERQRVGLFLLAAFLVTFALTRLWVRLQRSTTWMPSSVKSGELHVHHLVFGIVLALLAGFLSFVLDLSSPWLEVAAVGFGIGAALTLDEFALWLHLDDVYWAEQGRSSVDATVIAFSLGALVLLGIAPFGAGDEDGSVWAIAAVVVFHLCMAVICALKGKLFFAVIGSFIPLIGVIGAIRVARPSSWWARRFYPDKPKKLAKSEKRNVRWHNFRVRWFDRIAGAPSAD